MPRRTRDEEPPPELPPAETLAEFADESLPPRSPATATAQPAQALSHCSEADLLGLMSMQRIEPESARDAWEELYSRHARYVYAVVRRTLGKEARDEDLVYDLVSDTFRTLLDWTVRNERAGDVAERFERHDPDASRRRVLGFAAVVARRLALRSLAAHAHAPRALSDADIGEVTAPELEEAEPPPAREHSKLDEVLQLLSSDEAEALRVSLPWYQPEAGEFAFPRGEAARVAASLGITTDALRQRRSRSLRRLQALLGRP